MISLEKLKILTASQKLPKSVGDLRKLIVAKGFENCPIWSLDATINRSCKRTRRQCENIQQIIA